MDRLSIPHEGVEDRKLHYRINEYLAANQLTDMIAGSIHHPKNTKNGVMPDGILITTQFIWSDSSEEEIEMEEREEDLWSKSKFRALYNHGEKDLEWVTLWDTYNVTIRGLDPNDNKVYHTVYHISPAQTHRALRLGLPSIQKQNDLEDRLGIGRDEEVTEEVMQMLMEEAKKEGLME